MSAKFGPSRKAAFLKILASCGNQTLAAERESVSRSWVCLQRATDASFDAACRDAIGVAKRRLRRAACSAPPPPLGFAESASPSGGRGDTGWGFLDRAELVVRGSNGRRCQIGRARAGQWTARVEARFLAALAATCNVKAACAEVGKAHSSAYAHRKRWLAFAKAWDAAIEEGYVRIEAALLEHGCNLFSDPAAHDHQPIREMTAEQAIHLLHMHKHRVHGEGRAPGHPNAHLPQRLSEVMPSLLRKVDVIKRARTLTPATRAADRATFAARRYRGGGE